LALNRRPDFLHTVHQWAVDDVQWSGFLELEVQVIDQAFLGAFEYVVCQPAIQRQVGDLLLHPALGGAETLVEPGDVMLVDRCALVACLLTVIVRRMDAGQWTIPQQVINEFLFVVGNGGVALEFLGVDDGQVEPGLGRVIEKHGIDNLARGGRQTETDVADAEHGLALRHHLLDQPHAFDGFDRAADVVLVAGRAGEHQRIENQIFLGNAVRDAIIPGPPGDGQFAFARDRLGLLFVFIDRPDHDGRAELLDQRQHLVEFLLAILEIDRVDDAFALAIGQGPLDGIVVGRVDHERHFDLVDDLLVKPIDVRHFVAVAVFQVDVDDVRAALDLGARNLGRFLEFFIGNEPLECARADLVGALADSSGRLSSVASTNSMPV
jgi:hypothetical protein